MNLEQALQQIAERFDLDADELIAYAAEDNVGGWDYDHTKHRWPTGSIFGADGQILHALVRALAPKRVVTMGVMDAGCALTHIASALLVTGGRVTCVDTEHSAAYLVLAEYAPVIDFVVQHGLEYLAGAADESIDLLFDDLPKDAAQAQAVVEHARRVLRPGGLLVIHDAAHWLAGPAIRQGIAQAGLNAYLTVKPDETDCGLAIWQKPGAPGWDMTPASDTVARYAEQVKENHEQLPDEAKLLSQMIQDALTTDEEHEPVEGELPLTELLSDLGAELTAELLETLTVDELRKLASERGVATTSKMRKQEIINALLGIPEDAE